MRLINISVFCFVLLSCDPEKPVPVSDFNEKQLVVEGFFTDDTIYQEINVSLVNNIGDSTLIPVDNFDLKLSSLTQQHPFDFLKIYKTTQHCIMPSVCICKFLLNHPC